MSKRSFDEDDEDKILARVQAESLRLYNEVEISRLQLLSANSSAPSTSPSIDCPPAGSRLYHGPEAPGFDVEAGKTYIYPTNYPVRQYQSNIVRTALFKNTLVCLPTGLGKTFIAAVVMYNFYQWYPKGKIVFMAPTRPLVAQQIKACHNIMNIPTEDTTEMTGMQSAESRVTLWKEKRVFFLTPQVFNNDLNSKICPAEWVRCVVVDEAHRALKDYAYCQVLRYLNAANVTYRTLGLSATPGSDISAVQQVVQNLGIQCLELRGEDSIDVAPYTHSKCVEPIVVDLSLNIKRVRDDFLQVYDKYAKKLRETKLLSGNISNISKFQVWNACKRFRENPPRNIPPAVVGSMVSDFTVCMSLAHALELLQVYGLRAFYSYLTDNDMEKGKAAATRIRSDPDLKKVLQRLKEVLYPAPGLDVPYTWGHPKLQRLFGALSDHFTQAKTAGETTKAIVFCEYRVVVNEIVDILGKADFGILPGTFIGQSGGKGMKQSQQLKIMKDFRAGLINCIVATCVAEEGLDIGEVDLIVLMESHKSPVRLVQRIGRTGRKRRGKCIVLLTQGKEEYKFNEAMATRKSYVATIMSSKHVRSSLHPDSPRMVPSNLEPAQQLVHINVQEMPSPTKPEKRQGDIRSSFMGNNSPFLEEAELQEVMDDLKWQGSFQPDQLPDSHEYWPSIKGTRVSSDVLLQKKFSQLSSWSDPETELSKTFQISHSSATESFCDILKTNFVGSRYDKVSSSLSQEEMSVEPSTSSRRKKEVPKYMDIRTCLATLAEKWKPVNHDLINCDDLIESQNVDTDIVTIESDDYDLGLGVTLKECKNWLLNQKCLFEEDSNVFNRVKSCMLPSSKLVSWLTVPDLPDLDSFSNSLTDTFFKNLNWELEVTLLDTSNHSIIMNDDDFIVQKDGNSKAKLSPLKPLSPEKKVKSECLSKKNLNDSTDIVNIDDLFDEPCPMAGVSLIEQEYEQGLLNKQETLPIPTDLQSHNLNNSPVTLSKNTGANNKSCLDLFWEETPEGFSKLNLSLHLKSSTPVGTVVCSTPIVNKNETEKIQKKEVVRCLEKSDDIEKSFEDDFWNIDDLFQQVDEVEQAFMESPVKSQKSEKASVKIVDEKDITMVGVTQLCELIENEKSNEFVPYQPDPTHSKETFTDHNLSSLLDDETDIFNKIPEYIGSQAPVLDKPKSPLLVKEKTDNLDESFALLFSKKVNVKRFKKQISRSGPINVECFETLQNKTPILNTAKPEPVLHFEEFSRNSRPVVPLKVSQNLGPSKPSTSTDRLKPSPFVAKDQSMESNFKNGIPTLDISFISPIRKPQVNNETLTSPESPLITKRSKQVQRRDLLSSLNSSHGSKDSLQNIVPSKKRKINKDANGYIENEAEESGNVSSDDLDNSDLDGLDVSFIDDAHSSIDIHSKYLESVKSPMRGVFKIPQVCKGMNVYSQYVEPDSDYVNDSFCVGSEEESEQVEESYLYIVEEQLNSKKSKKNINTDPKKKPCTVKSKNELFDGKRKDTNKRKRIIILSDSGSDSSPQKNAGSFQVSSPPSKKIKGEGENCFKSDIDTMFLLTQQDIAASQDLKFDEDLKKAIEISRKSFGSQNISSNYAMPSTSFKKKSEQGKGSSRALKRDEPLNAIEMLNKKFNRRLSDVRCQYLSDSD